MTLSTGLGELRKALQDLRREEFMAREPADYELPTIQTNSLAISIS